MTPAVQARTERADAATSPDAVNDLSIRIGTVNGSGSQSANLVLVRALFGMGIPCSAKNVFPSNIEGLPTWFNIRVSKNGYIGHYPTPDVVVCMNAQTAAEDLEQLPAGGLCIYRDEFDRDPPFQAVRDRRASEVRLIPVPFNALAEQAFPAEPGDKTYRDKLRKVVNMVYVGVLASALGIEMETVRTAIRRQFPGRKAKAATINIQAADAGLAWGEENLPKDLPHHVHRMNATGDKILVDGNQASALGLVFGGLNVLIWYPITPSSSLAENAEEYLKALRTTPEGKHSYSVVQAEDELAAIGMVVGAGWAGARTATATSGPGVSLMTEFIGMAYFAEVPTVVVNVQRMGPSTGLPTRTSQGDILMMHLLGHGDCRHPVLIPSSPAECFSMSAQALDLAQDFQTPIFVALDLDLGMNIWMSEPFTYPAEPLHRGKVLTAEDLERLGSFGRYRDVDGDGACWRTLPGTAHPRAAYFTRGTGHNEQSGYSERPEDWKRNLDRLVHKLETARDSLPKPEIELDPKARVGVIAYGTTHWSAVEARAQLAEAGIALSYCRLRALPVDRAVNEFVSKHDRVYVVEQNQEGQVYRLLRDVLEGTLSSRLVSVTHYNGTPIAAGNITDPIRDWERTFSERGSLTQTSGNGSKTLESVGPVRSTE